MIVERFFSMLNMLSYRLTTVVSVSNLGLPPGGTTDVTFSIADLFTIIKLSVQKSVMVPTMHPEYPLKTCTSRVSSGLSRTQNVSLDGSRVFSHSDSVSTSYRPDAISLVWIPDTHKRLSRPCFLTCSLILKMYRSGTEGFFASQFTLPDGIC